MGESDNDSWSVVDDTESTEDHSPAAELLQHAGESEAGRCMNVFVYELFLIT